MISTRLALIHRPRRLLELVGVAAFALVATACGGGSTASPTLRLSTDNNCGGAYVWKSADAEVGTDCGSIVGYPPVRVALHPGEQFQVFAARIIGTTRYPAQCGRVRDLRLLTAAPSG